MQDYNQLSLILLTFNSCLLEFFTDKWIIMMTKKETWERLRKLKLCSGKMPNGKWELGGMGAENDYGMRGFDLKCADFSGAYIGSGNFNGADLTNANFSGA